MMTPKEIVHELNKHIVGQERAKRAVAVALRNRWRRQHVAEPLRGEIAPKNILMIGPTGVGKTEIARRLARLADAPFIKIEATKFTEVGYVGRDVDSIIRDLADIAVKQARESETRRHRAQAEDAAEERLLDILLPSGHDRLTKEVDRDSEAGTRQKMRKKLREGQIDDKEIDVDLAMPTAHMEVLSQPGMEDLTQQLQSMFQNLGAGRRRTRRMKVREALKALADEEAARLVNDEELKANAVANVEANGIVFLDEIDKIASRSEVQGADVSRQGVQRDLLPLVEGTTVNTKYGMIRTDHVLFIASGAFHFAKPSDLMPELQGRFPIRVELDSLSAADFERILTGTDACLVRQYEALLATEGVQLQFTDDGVTTLAQVAFTINERTENIGARRLHTVMEKLLEEVSYEAASHGPREIVIDASYVKERLSSLAVNDDLSRYVL
jgi:ATP-dependent HslUV protease ATP-binding subunit HslU